MAPVLDATLGGASSNSYVDLTFADAYAANTQWAATWLALAADDRSTALITATTWLETLSWAGAKCDPDAQRLAWPRAGLSCGGVDAVCTMIPHQIQTATVELAYQFSQNPNLMLGSTGTTSPGEVKRQKLDVLEVEYFQSGATGTASSGNLTDAVPWLKPWLGCWYRSRQGQVRLYRN